MQEWAETVADSYAPSTSNTYLKWFGAGRGASHLKTKHANTKRKMKVFQVLSQYRAKKCTLGQSSGCQAAQLV
jgi:hypothetical protein